jgi:3-hydroxy acid dehydrogenase/malonic semialdehyde reductase
MADRPVALVTGASRGIGRAIAKRIADRYDIIATARTVPELHSLAAEIEDAGGACRTIALDLEKRVEITRALKGIEADVLVNNAGIGHLKPFLELSADEWHAMVDVNFNALFHVTRRVLPGMIRRQSGHIVIIGSIAGRSAFVGGTCYGGTKHAVMGFSESLMLEVRDHGVKVTTILPGSVATAFGGHGDDRKGWELTSEDVAESVAHALSTPPQVLVHRLEVRALSPKRRR